METNLSNAHTRPILHVKYSNGILLLQQPGIRHGKYTWPTCTCPIKPGNADTRTIRRRIWQETPITEIQQSSDNSTSSRTSKRSHHGNMKIDHKHAKIPRRESKMPIPTNTRHAKQTQIQQGAKRKQETNNSEPPTKRTKKITPRNKRYKITPNLTQKIHSIYAALTNYN